MLSLQNNFKGKKLKCQALILEKCYLKRIDSHNKVLSKNTKICGHIFTLNYQNNTMSKMKMN